MRKINFKIILFTIAFIFTLTISIWAFFSSVSDFERYLIDKNTQENYSDIKIKNEIINNYINKIIFKLENSFEEGFLEELLSLDFKDEKYGELLNHAQKVHDEEIADFTGILRGDGLVISAKDKSFIGTNQLEGIKQYLLGGDYGYAVYFSSDKLESYLGISMTIFNQDRQKELGYFVIRTNLEELSNIMGCEFSDTCSTYLVNDRMLLLTPSRHLKGGNRGVLTQTVDTDKVKQCFGVYEGSCSGDKCIYRDFRGENVLGVFQLISSMNWCLINEVDYKSSVEIEKKAFAMKKFKWLLKINLLSCFLAFSTGLLLDKKLKIEKK